MTPAPESAGTAPIVPAVVDWFLENQRPLPWRGADPWGVLVSEFMLQQTPVHRVLPVWHDWQERWPTPSALADASVADALRAWGRLGYPRRARRLHEAATAITENHEGVVPDSEEELRALPGVGEYTAAAVMAFAYGRRSIVLDTNVRRVLARAVEGRALPPAHVTTVERTSATALWPTSDDVSALWSASVMELGALVCTARSPECDVCPLQSTCAWVRAGRPALAHVPRRQARFEGSDRQVRGRIMALLRDADSFLTASALAAAWPDAEQRDRALAGLVADGLVVRHGRGSYSLPE